MIDWNKPIETVPCDRNPVPVPCEFVGFADETQDNDAMVFIRGDWFASDCIGDGDNQRDSEDATDPWFYDPNGDGEACVSFLPNLRNVAESDQ